MKNVIKKFRLANCQTCQAEVEVTRANELAMGGFRCPDCRTASSGSVTYSQLQYRFNDGSVRANSQMSREELESIIFTGETVDKK